MGTAVPPTMNPLMGSPPAGGGCWTNDEELLIAADDDDGDGADEWVWAVATGNRLIPMQKHNPRATTTSGEAKALVDGVGRFMVRRGVNRRM